MHCSFYASLFSDFPKQWLCLFFTATSSGIWMILRPLVHLKSPIIGLKYSWNLSQCTYAAMPSPQTLYLLMCTYSTRAKYNSQLRSELGYFPHEEVHCHCKSCQLLQHLDGSTICINSCSSNHSSHSDLLSILKVSPSASTLDAQLWPAAHQLVEAEAGTHITAMGCPLSS